MIYNIIELRYKHFEATDLNRFDTLNTRVY